MWGDVPPIGNMSPGQVDQQSNYVNHSDHVTRPIKQERHHILSEIRIKLSLHHENVIPKRTTLIKRQFYLVTIRNIQVDIGASSREHPSYVEIEEGNQFAYFIPCVQRLV